MLQLLSNCLYLQLVLLQLPLNQPISFPGLIRERETNTVCIKHSTQETYRPTERRLGCTDSEYQLATAIVLTNARVPQPVYVYDRQLVLSFDLLGIHPRPPLTIHVSNKLFIVFISL